MATPQVFDKPIKLLAGQVPAPRDGAAPTAPAATVKLVEGSHLDVLVKRAKFQVTNGVLAVADANDYGSFKLVDLPTNPIALLSAKLDAVLTKDGVGYLAATDLDIAVGTAAASNTTLATTMLNVINKADFDASAIAPAVALHSASNTSPAPLILPTGAKALYLNASGATESGQAATLTVNGTIELTWMDLG